MDFNEAPAVTFTSVKSPEGFVWNYTMRGENGKDLLPQMTAFQKWCKENKWEPVVNQRGNWTKKEPEYVEGKVCPKCKGRLLKKIDKENKEYEQCENKKWDFTSKKDVGSCNYRTWPNSSPFPEEVITNENGSKSFGKTVFSEPQ